MKKPKTLGAYVHAKKGKYEGILLFKNIPEGMVESVLAHESIHMALSHIGENPEILDIGLKLEMVIPLIVVLEMAVEGGSVIEGLEVSSMLAREGNNIRNKLRKHQFVQL